MIDKEMASPVLSLSPNSPSFNAYSSDRLAEIAARVVEEFRQESASGVDDDFYQTGWPQQNQHLHQLQEQPIEEEEEEEDEDFEFAFVCKEAEESPISADEIFYNGQIRPICPLLDTKLLLDENQNPPAPESKPRTHRPQLRKLMSEERETTATTATSTSCSSSEADELDGAAPGTYCVWTPKKGSDSDLEESPGKCKKSNSTGNSSKRWKLRQLLYRSNSDGKDTFVFLAPSKRDKSSKEGDCGNRAAAGEKRRSYLPYRQDLVGIVSNVNGLSRNLHPF